jgi:hypothetical protein
LQNESQSNFSNEMISDCIFALASITEYCDEIHNLFNKDFVLKLMSLMNEKHLVIQSATTRVLGSLVAGD